MSDNTEQGVREAFSSALEGAEISAPGLDTSRIRYRRGVRISLLAMGMTAVVALAVLTVQWIATPGSSRGELRPAAPSGKTGSVGEWVTDGQARFRVDLGRCEDKFIESSDAPFCIINVTVANTSAEDSLELSATWQTLAFSDGKTYTTSNDSPAFREWEQEYISTHHAFREAVNPGEENWGELFFTDVPLGESPVSIELHSSKDSSGVTVFFRECSSTPKLVTCQ